MVTRLQAKDVPEPWFVQQKSSASTRQRKQSEKSEHLQDYKENTSVKKPSKRGRGRGKVMAELVDQTKQRRKRKRLPASTADIVLAMSETVVPNVDELRQKREEDALACGRTVRSVRGPLKQKDFPKPRTMHSTAGEGVGAPPRLLARGAVVYHQASSGLPPSAEENNNLGVDGPLFVEGGGDDVQPVFSRRPGKEPVLDDYNDVGRRPATLRSTVHVRDGYPNIDVDRECDEQNVQPQGRLQQRNPSPMHENENNRYGHTECRRSQSPTYACGRASKPTAALQSIVRSPEQNDERRHRRPRSCSPRPSYDSNIQPHKEDGYAINQQSGRQYYREHDKPERFSTGNGNSMRLLTSKNGLHRSYESSGSQLCYTRSSSRGEGREVPRIETTPDPSQSTRMTSVNGRQSMGREWAVSVAVKEELKASTSPTLDRKQRRKNQALQDLEKDRRQREGKKPFYLTLNDEGKPYGPGKLAWMAEINKLASGLDPSCTHVRKQTFEDVQTFKRRLDEKFDYSGTLNDDFLRALMGKAVTKRRGELIAVIKRGGTQPEHIDEDVWRRLEDLSDSKQREEKSEQGRYANACRRTLGRTGSIGINGIRENLRTRFGRSPDPDEIQEEMQRDKGYGGRKRKVQPMSSKKERSSLSDSRSQSFGNCSERDSSDTDGRSDYSGHQRNLHESRGARLQYGVHQMDDWSGRNDIGQKSYTVSERNVSERNRLSEDEYIRRLEGEIVRLQEEKANARASNTATQAMSSMSTGCGSSE